MSYQCFLAKKIARNIRNKQLGLVCSDYCNYYDLILFDFIDDELSSIDCSNTSYTDDYTYIISDNNLPKQSELDTINSESQSDYTRDCSGGSISLVADDNDLETCSNEIRIEFVNQNGVVTNNPNNGTDMRDQYYEFTFTGAETLDLPTKTLLRNIVFIPSVTTTIKVGESLAADDVVYEESITTSADNYPYTLNIYYESGITLHFTSTNVVKVRVYVD